MFLLWGDKSTRADAMCCSGSEADIQISWRSLRSVQFVPLRHREIGQLIDRPRSGRRRISTPREDRILVGASQNDWQATPTGLQLIWRVSRVNISKSTVKMRLKAVGLHGRRAVKSHFWQLGTDVYGASFCCEYQNRTQVDWSTVIFTGWVQAQGQRSGMKIMCSSCDTTGDSCRAIAHALWRL